MNNDTNKPQDLTSSQGLGLPPIPTSQPISPVIPVTGAVVPMPTIEATQLPTVEIKTEIPLVAETPPGVPSLPPVEVKSETPALAAETPPVTTTTTTIGSGGGLPPIEVKTETSGPAEKKPKRKTNIKMVVGGILAFFLLAGAAAVSYLLPGFRGDIRQRASYTCGDSGGFCSRDACNASDGEVPGSGTCSPWAPNCCRLATTTTSAGCTVGGACTSGGLCGTYNVSCYCESLHSCTTTTTTTTTAGAMCNGYCTADTCAENGDVPGTGRCTNPSAPNCCKAQTTTTTTTTGTTTSATTTTTTTAAACTLGATRCQGNNQPWRCTCVAVAGGNDWNCSTSDPSCGTGTTTGTTTTTTTAGGTCGTCGGSGQACCVPENCGAKPICNTGLYCNSGVCTTGTAICGGSQGEGGNAGGQCKVYKCGSKCNNGNQCSQGGDTVACAGANLGGECGQIDYLNETGGYCGVMTQNCYGSCAGTTTSTTTTSPGGTTTSATTTTSEATTTTTTGGTAPACAGTRVYINGSTTAATTAQLSELKIGDTLKLAVRGNRSTFTKGRFVVSVDGTTVVTQESTTKQNLPGDVAAFEFIYEHTITQAGSYSIQGSVWQ